MQYTLGSFTYSTKRHISLCVSLCGTEVLQVIIFTLCCDFCYKILDQVSTYQTWIICCILFFFFFNIQVINSGLELHYQANDGCCGATLPWSRHFCLSLAAFALQYVEPHYTIRNLHCQKKRKNLLAPVLACWNCVAQGLVQLLLQVLACGGCVVANQWRWSYQGHCMNQKSVKPMQRYRFSYSC